MQIAVVFDFDGVVRDLGGSLRRALGDTVEKFTGDLLPEAVRPTVEQIDALKQEGLWNNDWLGSQELIYRAAEAQGRARSEIEISFETIVNYFQSRYRGQGEGPDQWDGYITSEPLLIDQEYLNRLTQAQIPWGFFSGAPRGSVDYVLLRRLGLQEPITFVMEDGPEKPDPTGLMTVVKGLELQWGRSMEWIAYCGDTNSDMRTVIQARSAYPGYRWYGVGILPPHLWDRPEAQVQYRDSLQQAGADIVVQQVTDLTPEKILGISELLG